MNVMDVEYTEYAEMKIAKRKLSKSDIKETLSNPEKTIDSRGERKIAQKMIGNYILRVVFEKHGNVYKVITAYYSKPERYDG